MHDADEMNRFPWQSQRGSPRDGPLLLGHRGAPRAAPENSLAALEGALHAGLDGFETDLQRTHDGVLVLNHDPVVGDDQLICRLTAEEARRIAPLLVDLAGLEQLLTRHPTAVVNLEVKTDAPFGDARAAELVNALTEWPRGLRYRLWLSSFDPLLLLRLSDLGVPVPLGYLVGEASAFGLLPSLPVVAVHPHYSLVTDEHMLEWRDAGLSVFCWTVNSLEVAESLLALGVDGLIGDDPALLRQAAGRSGR